MGGGTFMQSHAFLYGFDHVHLKPYVPFEQKIDIKTQETSAFLQ